MPLFLKALDPDIDIFGNRQSFHFNHEEIPDDNKGFYSLVNHFIPTANTNLESSVEILDKNLNGFRLVHEQSLSQTYGSLALQTHSVFGSSVDIFKYDEANDKITFYKDVDFTGGPIINLPYSLYTSAIGTEFRIYNSNNSSFATSFSVYNQNTNNGIEFGLNNSTSEGYIWGQSAISLKFGTNNTIRMKINSDGSVNMFANRITNLGDPSASTDATSKDYVDNAISSAITQPSSSILHGYVDSNYTTDTSSGDHIKFSAVSFSRGSNISLDISSSYTTSSNTASIGRITLFAGRTYKLVGSLNNVRSDGFNATTWYNADNNTPIGLTSGSAPPSSTIDRVPSATTVAYITTSVPTRVELRSTWNSFDEVKGTEDAIGPAWFTVEEV